MTKNEDFGKFLTNLASDAKPMAKKAVDDLRERIEAEQAAKIEARLREVWVEIERKVRDIREWKRAIRNTKAEIAELEKVANDIVNGKQAV